MILEPPRTTVSRVFQHFVLIHLPCSIYKSQALLDSLFQRVPRQMVGELGCTNFALKSFKFGCVGSNFENNVNNCLSWDSYEKIQLSQSLTDCDLCNDK